MWVVERKYEGVEGVFSSLEKAKDYVREQSFDCFNIIEVAIDVPVKLGTPFLYATPGNPTDAYTFKEV